MIAVPSRDQPRRRGAPGGILPALPLPGQLQAIGRLGAADPPVQLFERAAIVGAVAIECGHARPVSGSCATSVVSRKLVGIRSAMHPA